MHLAPSHAICCLTQAHARQVKRRERKEPQSLNYAQATPELVKKEVRDKTEPAQFRIKIKTNASNFLKREVQDKNVAGGADVVAHMPQIAVCKTCMKVFKSIPARNGHLKYCKPENEIVKGAAVYPGAEPKTEALGESSIDIAVAGLLAMQAGAPKKGKVKSGECVVRLAKSVHGARATHKFKSSKSKILFKSSKSKMQRSPCNAYYERKGRVSRSFPP